MNVLQKLVEELKDAKLTTASFGFPQDRIEIKSLYSSGKGVKQRDVVHPDVYIKQIVKLYHETWIIGPLDRAIRILELHADVINHSAALLDGLEKLGLEELLNKLDANNKAGNAL